MLYRKIQPSEKFAEYIRFYWALESEEPYTHFAMADVCPELLFHYKGRFDEVHDNGQRESSFVSGIAAPTDRTRKFEINSSFGIFGVYFYPQAIPLLFNIPASEITNQMIDLGTMAKTFGPDLEDKIMNSETDKQRIEVIESFVEKRLVKVTTPQLPVVEALRHIMCASSIPKVKKLAADYFISERQLERQFLKFTGFNPKQFIRIARFHRAMQFYGNQELSLTEIALDCGYYDQSHFISDFKQFSGVTPRDFFSGRSPATTWRD